MTTESKRLPLEDTNFGKLMIELEQTAVEWSKLDQKCQEAQKCVLNARVALGNYIKTLLGRLEGPPELIESSKDNTEDDSA